MDEPKENKPLSAPHPSQADAKTEDARSAPSPPLKRERQEVITVRNWREYLGESALIIFSVVLALGLTEWFSKLHDEKETSQILHQLRDELISNQKAEEDQYQYHNKIMRNIDSALRNPEYAQKFLNNSEVHINVLIDSGVLRHDLNDFVWEIAKQHNVFSKLDLSTYALLTDLYDNQQKIAKVEDEIGRLLLSWESRKQENLRTTLILMHDTYVAWALGERAPRLLHLYPIAIERLKDY